jgi:endoglucanase
VTPFVRGAIVALVAALALSFPRSTGTAAVRAAPEGCLGEDMAASAPAAPRPGAVRFGAWVGADVNVAGDEPAFERAIGKRRAIRHWFWSAAPISVEAANFTTWSATMPPDAILLLSWAPSPFDSSLERVNDGAHDPYIIAWARALRDYGREVWLRPMWEDNGTWYWWRSRAAAEDGTKEQFQAAYRRVVDLLRREHADNVRFVWSPAVRGDGESIAILSYPGDAYVDLIGLDGYPAGSETNDFRAHFKQDYDELVALGKPLLIAETSINFEDDADRARYVTNVLACELPYHFPRIEALVWFSQPVWGDLLDPAYPRTREAFRAGIADPYYRGR